MQRLAALHQHIVRDIHHVVDRRRCPASASRSRQPLRAGADLHTANHPGRVATGRARGTRSATLVKLAHGVLPSRGCGSRHAAAARFHSTAISRATPMCPRQSGRLLVTSRSIARSSPTASLPSWFKPGHHQPLGPLRPAACPGPRNPSANSRKQASSRTAPGTARRSCRTRGCR